MGYHNHPHYSSPFSSPPLALQQLVFAVLYSSFAIYLATAATSNDTRPTVPLSCPSDHRTRIRVDDEGHTIMGEVMEDALIANVLTAFNENRTVTDFYIQTGGIYLFPEPVPYNSKIARIRALGYVRDELLDWIFQTEPSNVTVVPLLFPLVLRQDVESESYQLIHGLSVLLFHGLRPGSLPVEEDQVLNWAVKKGDRIGALIPPDCINPDSTTSLLLCPSYINLRATPQECLSALYYEVSDVENLENITTFPANQFNEVHVRLNLEATLVPQDSSATLIAVIAVVVAAAVAVLLGVVTIAGVCVAVHLRKSATPATEPDPVYETPGDPVYETLGEAIDSHFVVVTASTAYGMTTVQELPNVMTENSAYNNIMTTSRGDMVPDVMTETVPKIPYEYEVPENSYLKMI